MSFVLGGEDVPEGSLPFVVAFTHVRFRLPTLELTLLCTPVLATMFSEGPGTWKIPSHGV